jgi:TM2 domain-containing membrane protein YozV
MLLSLAWPGLGQAYRGEGRRGLRFAMLPLLALLAVGVLVVLLGPAVFVAYLLVPAYAALAGTSR